MHRVVAQFDRSKLEVQGDGRPFSMATKSPMATLRLSDVRPLIDPLKMGEKRKWALTGKLRQIMAEYLGPLLLAERIADHAATMKLLPQLSINCIKLTDQLSALSGPVLLSIEMNRREPEDGPDVPPFDIIPLVRKIRRLSSAVRRVRDTMKPRAKGPKEKKWLDQTVAKLLGVIEPAACKVMLLNSSSAQPRRQVRDTGGELLVALFRKLDPHVDEPQLWGAINRIRRAKEAEAAKAVITPIAQDT